ncbi:MAG: hypothetical protein V3S14_06865, partial [Anaerolineae bacterium]
MNTNMANVYEITRQRIEASREEAVRALVRSNAMLSDEVQMLQAATHRLLSIVYSQDSDVPA